MGFFHGFLGLVRQILDTFHHFLQSFRRFIRDLISFFDLLQRGFDQFPGMYRRLCTVIRKLPDLFSHHGEASSGFPRSGSFNCCIQGQQVRLGCDILDLTDNITDLLGSLIDPLHGIGQSLHLFSTGSGLLLIFHCLLIRCSESLGIFLHDLSDVRNGRLQFLYGTGLICSTLCQSLCGIRHLPSAGRHLAYRIFDLTQCLTELMIQLANRLQQSAEISYVGFPAITYDCKIALRHFSQQIVRITDYLLQIIGKAGCSLRKYLQLIAGLYLRCRSMQITLC